MCSIMGYLGKGEPDKFEEAFGKTVSRGPDDSRIISMEDGILAFTSL